MLQHGNLFTRRQRQHISSPNQQASSLNSGLVFLSNSSDANGPHDGAFGNIDSFRQYNGARGRQENGTRRSRVQPQPVEKSDVRVSPKSRQGDKMGPQEQRSESSAKVLSSGVDGIAYTFPSPGDEDECPTCLEGMFIVLRLGLSLSLMHVHKLWLLEYPTVDGYCKIIEIDIIHNSTITIT